MKLIVLAENTAPECSRLKPEHGLSLYLEYAGKKLLLDAGASGCFADNAERLGVDLAAVELAVLSHGHYDHAGGLARFSNLIPLPRSITAGGRRGTTLPGTRRACGSSASPRRCVRPERNACGR